jgi:hypothetical protein
LPVASAYVCLVAPHVLLPLSTVVRAACVDNEDVSVILDLLEAADPTVCMVRRGVEQLMSTPRPADLLCKQIEAHGDLASAALHSGEIDPETYHLLLRVIRGLLGWSFLEEMPLGPPPLVGLESEMGSSVFVKAESDQCCVWKLQSQFPIPGR